MLTPGEIQAVNVALAHFKSQIDAADAEAGVAGRVGDWFFDLFSFRWTGSGEHPREDVRRAAVSSRLYDVLVAKRNEVIESPEELHEEALMLVEVANRAAGWDRAASISQMRADTDVPGAVGEAAQRVVNAAAGVAWGKWIVVGLVAVIVFTAWPVILAVASWAGIVRKRASRR